MCVNSMEVVMMASFSLGYRCSNETCCNSSNHCVYICVCVSVYVCEYVSVSVLWVPKQYHMVSQLVFTLLCTCVCVANIIKRSQSAIGMSKFVYKGSLLTEPKVSQLELHAGQLGVTEDKNGDCFLFALCHYCVCLQKVSHASLQH